MNKYFKDEVKKNDLSKESYENALKKIKEIKDSNLSQWEKLIKLD